MDSNDDSDGSHDDGGRHAASGDNIRFFEACLANNERVREKILKHASSTPVLYGSPVAGFELGVGSEMHIEESSEVSSEVVNEPIGGHKGVDAHLTGSREGTTVEPSRQGVAE